MEKWRGSSLCQYFMKSLLISCCSGVSGGMYLGHFGAGAVCRREAAALRAPRDVSLRRSGVAAEAGGMSGVVAVAPSRRNRRASSVPWCEIDMAVPIGPAWDTRKCAAAPIEERELPPAADAKLAKT